MPEDGSLFTVGEQSRRSAELQAFVAPFSRSANTVLADPSEATQQTLAICELFLDAHTPPALSRGDIASALAGRFSAEVIHARIDRLREARVLLPAKGRAREARYRLRTVGYLGALFAERVDEAGLLEEFWGMLDRTGGRLSREQTDARGVGEQVATIRRGLIGYAGELEAVAETGTREDVMRECRRHDRGGRTAQVEALCRQIQLKFPQLSTLTRDLIVAAQSYLDAVQRIVSRLHADGLAAGELFLLDAVDYEDTARTASLDVLAQFGENLIVDTPTVVLDADALLEATGALAYIRHAPRRRPRSAVPDDADPLGEAQADTERRRQELVNFCERHLQGEVGRQLAEHFSRLTQASAMAEISLLMEAHLRPDLPYALSFADGVRVDVEHAQSLSWLTPVVLHGEAGRSPVEDEVAHAAR